jgi:UDP-N-acetylmuramate dehydrogenase
VIPVSFDVDLSSANTLRLAGRASVYGEFSSVSEFLSLLAFARLRHLPLYVLGGGSNILLPERVEGLVVQSAMTGVTCLGLDEDSVWVRVEAGKSWHQWVCDSILLGHGLENLALIPGTVGAAPVQNIGAYGVEVGNLIESVQGYQMSTAQFRALTAAECRFGYRDSVFKRELLDDFVVLSVVFRLSRRFQPDISYGPLAILDAETLTPGQLIERVCEVRASRLPDPACVPNAGSFFKNPIVPKRQAEQLLAQYPNMPVYPASRSDRLKLAAAWLIDQTGWKGRWMGPVGMHDQQALVMVTNGNASLLDIRSLQNAITLSVQERFQVCLEPEPILLGAGFQH